MSRYKLSIKTSIWFCGLSGAGKTTISRALKHIVEKNTNSGVILLDGDELVELFSSKSVIRSEEARLERVKKYANLVRILLKTPNVLPVLVMINHSHTIREKLQSSEEIGKYFEVFVNTSLKTCQKRDPKGHYSKAAETENPNMIGLDINFDIPDSPDVEIDESFSPGKAAEKIFETLKEQKVYTLD